MLFSMEKRLSFMLLIRVWASRRKIKKICFKLFYRASNVATQPGTGLGLLIAKQSVELHKGTITFTSGEGQGTTFIITLPRIIGKENDI
jgi:signal transduction histidine kinase